MPRIDVTLGYDRSGIVRLFAKEHASGREIRSEIECPALMSGGEVERSAEHVRKLKVT